MGATDSKLSLTAGLSRLHDQLNIPSDDPFWNHLWELPRSDEDVSLLLSPQFLRRVRESAPENIKTLISVVVTRLLDLRHHPDFPSATSAPAIEAVNCIRILNRVIPHLHDCPHLAAWEDGRMWLTGWSPTRTGRQTGRPAGPTLPRPLGAVMVDLFVDLLFTPAFTVAPDETAGRTLAGTRYPIWHDGVGSATGADSTAEWDDNRVDLIRVLLAMMGHALFLPQDLLPSAGVRATTYLTTHPNKTVVLALLCSLLNTALAFNRQAWQAPYAIIRKSNISHTLAVYALQLLVLLVEYPVPASQSTRTKNKFRHFLGRIHQTADLEFVFGAVFRTVNQPLHSLASYLPGHSDRSTWIANTVVLLWEIVQCNKTFRSFVLDSDRSRSLTMALLLHIVESKEKRPTGEYLRLCVYLLQTISADPAFGRCLNARVPDPDGVPYPVRIDRFSGSYADFLIQTICSFLSTGDDDAVAMMPSLLTTVCNISPFLTNVETHTGRQLMRMFTFFASSDNLVSHPSNPDAIFKLVDIFSAILENNPRQNNNVASIVVQHRHVFLYLRNLSVDDESVDQLLSGPRRSFSPAASPTRPQQPAGSRAGETGEPSPTSGRGEELAFIVGSDDDDDDGDGDGHSSHQTPANSTHSRPVPQTGLSDKARGKLPVNDAKGLTTSTSGTYIPAPNPGESTTERKAWIQTWLPHLPLHTILALVQMAGPKGVVMDTEASSTNLLDQITLPTPASDRKPRPFEWTSFALGWYESLLWTHAFQFEAVATTGRPNMWKGTTVKLFRVEMAASAGPSLLAPRGAVDAVGDRLVSMISRIGRGANGGDDSAASPSTTADTGSTTGLWQR